MLKKFWHRISDRDRLAYSMVIVFGVCLLAITIFFQFGYMLGEKQIEPNPFIRNEPKAGDAKLLLLDEPSPVVRGIEAAISLGLIVLGIERLATYKKRMHK